MESIIVDANKVMASFITEGIVHDTLFSGKFIPIAPEKLLEEVKKHKGDIAKKSGMNLSDVESAIELLLPDFKVFSRDMYLDRLKEAKGLSPHLKDVEYFALSLSIGCPIWSNEKAFKEQSRIKVFSTSELLNFLSE
ncbi:MAG: hypothetical protein A7316_05500 [Candidatus Altiarchaeales archaeon WOR_SM1_86-2]|nr:MAG: hypothetical protein A7316_05500 [Candidatus Altiarchaeales archaeon WOR_SM1_86-2]